MSVYSKSLFIQIYKGNKEFQLISLKKNDIATLYITNSILKVYVII